MWEQRSIHLRKDISDIPDTEEQHVRNHLATTQSQVIDNALRLWRAYWNRRVSQPSSIDTHGLYRDRALVYWFLGNAMNRRQGSVGAEFFNTAVNGQKTLKIPHLLRSLSVLADSGQLDNMSEEPADEDERLARCLLDLQGSENAETHDEVDTVILSCMMRKGRGESN